MRARCLNPDHPAFPDYGGRGIAICDRWRDSFEAFLADMGERPSPSHSIDRHPDNDGPYEPGNVRWATDAEQAINRRNVRTVEVEGETVPLIEAAARIGLSKNTVHQRLFKGWSVERILATPLDSRRSEAVRRARIISDKRI